MSTVASNSPLIRTRYRTKGFGSARLENCDVTGFPPVQREDGTLVNDYAQTLHQGYRA